MHLKELSSLGRHAAAVFLLLLGASLFGVPAITPAAAQLFPSESSAQTSCWTQTCGPQRCPSTDYPGKANIKNCIKTCRANSCSILQTVLVLLIFTFE